MTHPILVTGAAISLWSLGEAWGASERAAA
jgi:hypothetical protein